MSFICLFDPWKGPLCTCPPKYTLNPYTGCEHGCLYCYITSFIPHAFTVREKRDLLKKVEREIARLDQSLYLSLSNSSDPYPRGEEKRGYTRSILKMCGERNLPVLILTKSPLVLRDIDLLKKMNAAVSITITTIDDQKSNILEPRAPRVTERIQAIKHLAREGIPTILRLDPIILGLNDDLEEWKEILHLLKPYLKQVVVSTFKPRPDSWSRIACAFPHLAETREYYSEKIGNSLYLPKEKRKEMLSTLRNLAHQLGIPFSSCREGLSSWNDLQCDGSSLLTNQ